MPAGRPSDYTPETADKICARLAEGEGLRAICRTKGMPDRVTVYRWLANNEEFRNRYALAREMLTDYWSEDILNIADDSSRDTIEKENSDGSTYEAINHEFINRSRLRIDARKWLMSKLFPTKYGDRVVNEHTGKDGGPIATMEVSDADRAKALAAFMAKTRAQTTK